MSSELSEDPNTFPFVCHTCRRDFINHRFGRSVISLQTSWKWNQRSGFLMIKSLSLNQIWFDYKSCFLILSVKKKKFKSKNKSRHLEKRFCQLMSVRSPGEMHFNLSLSVLKNMFIFCHPSQSSEKKFIPKNLLIIIYYSQLLSEFSPL